MARQETAGTIINRCAVEVGLAAVSDPFSSQNEGFSQLSGLINVAGQELVQLRDWNEIIKPISVNTSADITDGNLYTLPSDFDRLIPQTGWDQTNDIAIAGPLTPQDWSYLEGRNLASSTIYLAFRQYQARIEFYPTTVPTGRTLAFQYVSRNWATNSTGDTEKDFVDATSDVVLLDPLLVQKFLKVKWLSAKNLPSQDAKVEFENVLLNRMGNTNSAAVLNAARNYRGYPYLNGFYNLPDTGYGS